MILEMFNFYLNFLFVNHVNRMATAILDFMNAQNHPVQSISNLISDKLLEVYIIYFFKLRHHIYGQSICCFLRYIFKYAK